MALDTVQDISAITELVFTGLKMTGISLLTVCSVLGTDYYFRDYVDKEKRMKDTVTQWRAVLSCLNEKQKGQIGANAVVEMNELLNQYVSRRPMIPFFGQAKLTATTGWTAALVYWLSSAGSPRCGLAQWAKMQTTSRSWNAWLSRQTTTSE